MVYLLHFEPALAHVRHFTGATTDPILANAIARGDVSGITAPIVVAARQRGLEICVARTWSSRYQSVGELPHSSCRRKLCPQCLDAERVRRRR